MSTQYNDIAVVGFSAFEFSTLETFFRLVSSRRARPYRAVRTGANAAMVIVDGSDETLVKKLVGLLRPAQMMIVVGPSSCGTAWPNVPRPINLSLVLGLVDRSFAAAAGQAMPQPAAPQMAAPKAANGDLARATLAAAAARNGGGVLPAGVHLVAKQASQPAPKVDLREAPAVARVAPTAAKAVAAPPPAMPLQVVEEHKPVNILVVDDSDVALKFIHSRLSAFGFAVDLASSGEEALVKVSENSYSFVFLDVMMEGLDGYQTCKAIKKRKFESGRAPVVVMLTSRGGTVDKVRGTFAGCDAYLTKPLDESKMLRVLLKHDTSLADHIDTQTRMRNSPPTVDPELASLRGDKAQRAILDRLDESAGIR
jgi:two-component system, cell cycle response regulator